MKKRNLINKILVGTWVLLTMTLTYAGAPLWTFKPLTATTINVSANGMATVKYQVTNQSRKSHTLVMTAIPGITQVNAAGNCPSLFSLAYQQSCTLTLQVNASSLSGDVIGGPVVCQQGNTLQCYQPSQMNSLNITKSKISTYTVGGTITGLTGTVTLLNNGTNSTPISTDGPFTFSTPIAEGSTYTVTVGTQPVDQTCSVANGSGTINGTNVVNVTVTCSTNTYTVGGTVTGLTPETVTLLNNGTNATPISADGPFTFSVPIAEGSTYNVTVGTQPVEKTCTVTNGSGIVSSNVTTVAVNCVTNNTTLSVSATGIIPVNNGSGTLTVTNTGTTYTAYNVHAVLPVSWAGVIQNSSACTSIAPNGGTCMLTFTSTTPYLAQGSIMVTGDNIISPPTTALAFSIDTYLVWSVSGTSPSGTALVLASSDASSSQLWSTTDLDIGITELSVTPCNGATDGACDTGQIESNYRTPYTAYAAGLCYEITSDNSGTVLVGTWYLPAICQMGGAGQGAGCSSGLANIDTNLVQLGFGGLSGGYWSSTEYSFSALQFAWNEFFASGGSSHQVGSTKDSSFLRVRCSRALTF
jgi:hypothetical protein